VATPPRVTRTEADAAIERIHRRHARVDDPRRSELSDQPAEVLEYLTRHSALLPQWAIALDVLDGLSLSAWLWWEDRRRERALLRRGARAALYWREMGTPLGIRSHQGVRDRLDRLDALLSSDRPDEQLAREARRAAARTGDLRLWGAIHGDRVGKVIARLLEQLARPELAAALTLGETPTPESDGPAGEHAAALAEADEWLTELRADLDRNSFSPATLSVLGLAIAPLRLALHNLGLSPGHGLWRALRDADALRSDLADQSAD
jgi:hypothetical protein